MPEAHLGEGTLVEVTAEGDTITARPARYRHYKNLAEVLAEFKPEHRRGEEDSFGEPVGREIW